MKPFMDEDFLLDTDVAKRLYHEAAEGLPIIDYHCHLSPREIWENRPWPNLTRLWLGGDHYKWRLMRWAGVDEKFITGCAPDREKFQKWAETLALAVGNPLYHWSHMELKRFFGYDGLLNGDTAETVWRLCNEKLQSPDFTPRGLIARSNVETVCTTDDPADSLEYHRLLAADEGFPATVLPAWRPDKALSIEKDGFAEYLRRLGEAAGVAVSNLASLKAALQSRMAFFHENGCRLSDHALSCVMYEPATDAELDAILRKRLAGESVTEREARQYRTGCLRWLAGEYSRRSWAMQLHYGAKRDVNPPMFALLGPDTGYDCVDSFTPSAPLADFLGSIERPKTILYSLNPGDDAIIASVIGCFQDGRGITKMQLGSEWWFGDHLDGIRRQLRALASQGYLAGFIGMLTDSRSFLSYPRHEYFRRILCALLGQWVESGLYPEDFGALSRIVRGVCHDNAQAYFQFPTKQ